MKNKVFWLRLSYWLGAAADGLAAAAMLSPKIGKIIFGLANFTPGADYTFAMGIGAPLMLGWTVLLLWADREPVSRRGILLITVFPIISGIVLTEVIAVKSEFISISRMLPLWVMQAGLSILMIFSYFNARALDA